MQLVCWERAAARRGMQLVCWERAAVVRNLGERDPPMHVTDSYVEV